MWAAGGWAEPRRFPPARPAGGETRPGPGWPSPRPYFNPLAPRGTRPDACTHHRRPASFQPTRPAGGETPARRSRSAGSVYFNPLAPRGARHVPFRLRVALKLISTHSPRGGRDDQDGRRGGAADDISTHSPRVGRDGIEANVPTPWHKFQPTRPAWGETGRPPHWQSPERYFNPLAPRGARPWKPPQCGCLLRFQSTRPAWGETQILSANNTPIIISIHSPRGGRDAAHHHGPHHAAAISTHSPRVGRDRHS